jgi:hypothetical protein
MLSEAAAAHDIVLVGGSIPERGVGVGGGGGADEEDVLYNACCVFDGKRGLIARHRKTHLFDVDIPGEISFRESDTLTEGEGLTVVDTAVGRVGVGICFDVRFGEMAAAMANRGADGASVYDLMSSFGFAVKPLGFEFVRSLPRLRRATDPIFSPTDRHYADSPDLPWRVQHRHGTASLGTPATRARRRQSGAFYTLVPIRPRWRGERRSLRTFAVVSLRPSNAFNPRPRRL